MENKLKEETPTGKHRNSLLRIARVCGIPRDYLMAMETFDIEDHILSRLEQGILERKRDLALIRQLRKESDMLRQTSIFDFLKIHYDEIQTKETQHILENDGKDRGNNPEEGEV